MKSMRRNDREVTDFTEITDILHRVGTIHLGLHSEMYPYVVPLSFGFEALNERIALYFHGATEGLKHDLIEKNPLVCLLADLSTGNAAIGVMKHSEKCTNG